MSKPVQERGMHAMKNKILSFGSTDGESSIIPTMPINAATGDWNLISMRIFPVGWINVSICCLPSLVDSR